MELEVRRLQSELTRLRMQYAQLALQEVRVDPNDCVAEDGRKRKIVGERLKRLGKEDVDKIVSTEDNRELRNAYVNSAKRMRNAASDDTNVSVETCTVARTIQQGKAYTAPTRIQGLQTIANSSSLAGFGEPSGMLSRMRFRLDLQDKYSRRFAHSTRPIEERSGKDNNFLLCGCFAAYIAANTTFILVVRADF